MTTLRTFQTEIDEIAHRELIKQRTHATYTAENRQPLSPSATKGKAKDASHTNGAELRAEKSTRSGLHEIDEKILASFLPYQTLFLSHARTDHDEARNLVAGLLTQHRGEYVLRIGLQPSHTHLFEGNLTDASDGWTGTSRTVEELDILKEQVTKVVEEVGGKTCILFETRTGHPRASLLLRLPQPDVSLTPEVRCAVVGNVDSGKSTTLGVLTRGTLDDGRGRARVGLFRHKHEIETGRTSSVGMEILGFEPSGAPILPNTANPADLDAMRHEKLGWEEISVKAAKIVSFIDLAGHERYLKTTLYGLTSGAPSCVILIVGANAGLIGMSKEHLAIALALSVPIVVCITKGQVRTFLNLLPSSEVDDEKFAVDQPLEFSVTEVWSVPYVGTVVNGILNSGKAKTGDAVLIGPDSNGNYIPTIIRSMQRKRATVTTAEAGQCVSFALKRVLRASVRKGMVLVHKTETPPRSTCRFEGQVLILYHNTTLQKNYQAMLHCGAVRQTVRIVEMDHPQGVLRTGDRAIVTFEFISHPEFVKVVWTVSTLLPAKILLNFVVLWTRRILPKEISEQQTDSEPYSLSPDPRQWGSDLSVNLVEPDDDLHNPARGFSSTSLERGGSFCSTRGVANFGCLFILGIGLITLFAGYPMISHFTRTHPTTQGGFNLGGINATGQIPSLPGNWGLIDLETPTRAYKLPAWTEGTSELQLIFSDEFNTDGRTFYPGDDPYWEAVDLHYWATNNLEWYDPSAVTTKNGSLVVTLSATPNHDLNYMGARDFTNRNKFCFTGGYIESRVQLPGANNVVGLWPAIWTMGNLGRAGYGASLEGMWPYTYDACDVGTAPNQTINGLPEAAVTEGDPYNDNHLSYLPGQRLSRCTCKGESHPGPVHTDGSYVGRAAPEIDVFEALVNAEQFAGQVSQSSQWAPFNENYIWKNTSSNLIIYDDTVTEFNTYIGGATQMTTSALSWTNPDAYELNGQGFSIYGFEYKPDDFRVGFDTGYITWISDNKRAWTFRAPGMAADDIVQVSARPVPQEPMYIIVNLGMSENFGKVDLDHLTFPTQMKVDYIRVYQPADAINYGCNPPDFPTADYINTYIEAYTNPNLTTWVDDYKQPFPKNSLIDHLVALEIALNLPIYSDLFALTLPRGIAQIPNLVFD
ncbi:hypothetical protein C0995_010379 [Termitomyces sp. Mi166|nr:hypothetical protein C0995_010379 [Termitomyces sp. Mi166\